MNAITAQHDARLIVIKRESAGNYVVMLDHVKIVDATIRKVGKGWMITTPLFNEGTAMVFGTLKDASAHMISWFRLSYIPMLNADHAVAEMTHEAKRTIKISRMDYPVPYGRVVTEAHVKICNEFGHVTYVKNGMDMGICPRCGETTTSEEQITKEEIDSQEMNRNPVAAMRMSESDPIADVIRFANEAIAALMPNLAATKLAFETLRDDESAKPHHVDLAYQVYSDTHRSIEEYRRTIAYAEAD